ncbi:MAG: hypothetical protein MZV63_02990 [Marinilabiliales bacterium]|nr:hypothetical protein [Marinilabiliales bacterium]
MLTPAFNQLTGKTLGRVSGMSNGVLFPDPPHYYHAEFFGRFLPGSVAASFDPVDVLKGTMSPGSMSKRLRAFSLFFSLPCR